MTLAQRRQILPLRGHPDFDRPAFPKLPSELDDGLIGISAIEADLPAMLSILSRECLGWIAKTLESGDQLMVSGRLAMALTEINQAEKCPRPENHSGSDLSRARAMMEKFTPKLVQIHDLITRAEGASAMEILDCRRMIDRFMGRAHQSGLLDENPLGHGGLGFR